MQEGPINILLVEDNASHAELVVDNLKEHEVSNAIRIARDGAEAMDYLHQKGDFADPKNAPRPDLVLLDLRLPKIDGLEVLKRIKTDDNLATIPVVVLTTSDAEIDVARAYENHANSYLVKPIDFDAFKTLMDNLGFYWLNWNEKYSGNGKS